MTYSIVARDPDTGELGVAVQSMYFHVGPVVPWAEAGVGAVATQSVVNVAFGPLGLDLLRGGLTAAQALAAGGAQPTARAAVGPRFPHTRAGRDADTCKAWPARLNSRPARGKISRINGS